MPTAERVTVTLPGEILHEIERVERNRSKFVLDAVRRELLRRRREELRKSLANPHPESESAAEAGFDRWASSLPEEAVAELVEFNSGTPVSWVPGKGWLEASE